MYPVDSVDMEEAEAQELQQLVTVDGAKEPDSDSELHRNVRNSSPKYQFRNYKWWLRVTVYSFLVLFGQTVATLLGRLYYEKGGKSEWMSTLVQLVGFPICVPYLYCLPLERKVTSSVHSKQPSSLIIALVYISFGVLIAADSMLYSIGLLYVPVSAFSLICASQLAFNALFSIFLNSLKLNPFIVISVVLLTISSALLAFESDSTESSEVAKENKYAFGFLCTLAASAGYALILSLTQLAFDKVLKRGHRAVVDMMIYPAVVASVASIIGLFVSGEWANIGTEMQVFGLGRFSYVMTLIWIAVCWQVFSIGDVCLIYEVSSLFSNSVQTLGLPITPIFAVIFFRDKMDSIKAIAMILAICGFFSYLYQQYLNEAEPKRKRTDGEASLTSYSARNEMPSYCDST